jgi:hypothetical protein
MLLLRRSLCHFCSERHLVACCFIRGLLPRTWLGCLLFATLAFALTTASTALASCAIATFIRWSSGGCIGWCHAFQGRLFDRYAGRAWWSLGARLLGFGSGLRACRFFRARGVITVAARLVALTSPIGTTSVLPVPLGAISFRTFVIAVAARRAAATGFGGHGFFCDRLRTQRFDPSEKPAEEGGL